MQRRKFQLGNVFPGYKNVRNAVMCGTQAADQIRGASGHTGGLHDRFLGVMTVAIKTSAEDVCTFFRMRSLRFRISHWS
jgi:hypothetical protein